MKNNFSKDFLSLVILSGFLFLMIFLIGNEKVFLFLNRKIANPLLDFIVLYLFNPLFLLLGIVPLLMLFSKKEKTLGLFSLISGPLSYLIGHLIKPLFAFPRPYEVLGARLLGPWHTSTFSFPSTTTILAFGFALPLLIWKPKIGRCLLILPFLVGFSVIYTGFHTPFDVLAGILFSLLFTLFFNKVYENFRD